MYIDAKKGSYLDKDAEKYAGLIDKDSVQDAKPKPDLHQGRGDRNSSLFGRWLGYSETGHVASGDEVMRIAFYRR